MATLAQLVDENYYELKSEECKSRVLAFIRSNPLFPETDIEFLKRLTKVTDLILESDPGSINGMLNRVFEYHMEGVRRVKKLKYDGSTFMPERFSTLEAHFLSHAGSFAEAIFLRTGDLSWGLVTYNCRNIAADISVDSEHDFAVYNYSFAGEAAKLMFDKTSLAVWGERWYDNKLKSAELSEKTNPRHSAYSYARAGDAAKMLFQKISHEQLTEKISWAERWYLAYLKSAEMSRKSEPIHAGYAYGIAAFAAKEAYKLTQDTSWAERAYANYLIGARMTEKSDSRHSAIQSSFAGNMAFAIYKATDSREWGLAAMDCYRTFFRYFLKYPEQDLVEVIKSLRSNFDFLTRQLGI